MIFKLFARKDRVELPSDQPAIIEILRSSKVNGGTYRGEDLPVHRRIWPSRTWLQTRRQYLRLKGEE